MRSDRHRGKRGVTLLELLIVISLLSLLTVGMAMTIRIGLNTLDRTSTRLNENRRTVGAQRVLDQQLAGLIPVRFSCAGGAGRQALFFDGTPDSMRLVSSYTLEEAARGFPRILEYAVTANPQGAGVRLVVNEYHYTGPGSLMPLCAGPGTNPTTGGLLLRPAVPTPASFVLADKLALCRLSYLATDRRLRTRAWLPTPMRGLLPEAVRFEMVPLEPDPARIQMATMTVPVRVSRNPDLTYDDIDPVRVVQ
ncbi:MAG: prepilin-type N-terminal cleavage/methylation domain-containing protein [Bryobacteraceae bacterium]